MKLHWWCEGPQVSVVKTVVTLPSFVDKYQCFRRMCCLYLESVRVKTWYIKRGGWDRKPLADYDCSIQLTTDADFHIFAVTSYHVMHNYVEMILSLKVLNILHHEPKVVECCVLFTRELEVSYQIMPLAIPHDSQIEGFYSDSKLICLSVHWNLELYLRAL